jgi:uncharacterized protein (TIGR02391 family)
MRMSDPLAALERIARQAHLYSHAAPTSTASAEHPFVARDIHEGFPPKVRKLFDDSHYAEATFGAYKYLDQAVQRLSKLSKSGEALMMEAFKEDAPKIQLTPCSTTTERDEQKGYRFLFAGAADWRRGPHCLASWQAALHPSFHA